MIDPNASSALGRLPSGLYVLTARHGDRSTGMLASWVQQAGFQPLSLTVAVAHGRFVHEWVEASGRFVLNQLGSTDTALLKHFGKGFAPEEDAFKGLELLDSAKGGPVLARSAGYLDCEVTGQVDSGDHRVYLATVVAGQVFQPERAPYVHTRRNAAHY